MTTILLWLGLAASLMTIYLSNFSSAQAQAAARNWSYLQMVVLWIFFLLK